MAYRYDLFVSYCREPVTARWVHMVLMPPLRDWLRHEARVGGERIFIDVERSAIPPGAVWAETLKEAVLSSVCLLPILTAEYFQSPWCLMELTTFLARAKETQPPSVVPILFSNGKHFAPEALQLQLVDMKAFSWCRSRLSTKAFLAVVRDLAISIDQKLKAKPAFDPSWRIHESESHPLPFNKPPGF